MYTGELTYFFIRWSQDWRRETEKVTPRRPDLLFVSRTRLLVATAHIDLGPVYAVLHLYHVLVLRVSAPDRLFVKTLLPRHAGRGAAGSSRSGVSRGV